MEELISKIRDLEKKHKLDIKQDTLEELICRERTIKGITSRQSKIKAIEI